LEQKVMSTVKHLERAALGAHRRGIGWATFWNEHGDAIRMAEPFDRGRYRSLVNRLLHLLTTGEASGMEPAGDDDMPWEVDDQQIQVADTGTAAKINWSAAGIMAAGGNGLTGPAFGSSAGPRQARVSHRGAARRKESPSVTL
jgi:hypothetical protein